MSTLNPYYVVITNKQNKDQIVSEFTSGANALNRVVTITKPMPLSDHNIEALLTQAEADILKTDSRMIDVHLDPEEFLGIVKRHHNSESGVFDNSLTTCTNTMINYGLIHSIDSTNHWSTGYTYTGTYTYHLDGTGIDIVMMDTGVEPYHPEFAVNNNGTGGTRVIDLDWTQYGVSSVPTGGFLGDCEGHGSNCASIAAGNIRGWAKNAHIYSLRIVEGDVSGTQYDITTGAQLGMVNELEAWTAIKTWHLSKVANTGTTFRPTIVSCSYGYNDGYYGGQMQSVNYRGTTHSLTTTTGAGATNYGTIGIANGGDGTFGYRYSAIEAEVTSCLNAGVIIVGAAGNNAHKIDVPTGTDYNNYIVQSDQPGVSRYYHRGMTPSAVSGVICVGALDNTYTQYDAKAFFSCTGPRVDIFAPGVQIMGAYANARYYTNASIDPRSSASTSSNYTFYLNKISGTSQATPQVTGILACILQVRPQLTATTALSFLTATSFKNLMNENALVGSGLASEYPSWATGTYTNLASLQGAVNGLVSLPFNSAVSLSVI